MLVKMAGSGNRLECGAEGNRPINVELDDTDVHMPACIVLFTFQMIH